MQLVYIYIEKKWVVDKKGFSFTSKYIFKENYINNILQIDISKNENYINNFFDKEGKILNITGLVGNNGCGKTTLLTELLSLHMSKPNMNTNIDTEVLTELAKNSNKIYIFENDQDELICYSTIDNLKILLEKIKLKIHDSKDYLSKKLDWNKFKTIMLKDDYDGKVWMSGQTLESCNKLILSDRFFYVLAPNFSNSIIFNLKKDKKNKDGYSIESNLTNYFQNIQNKNLVSNFMIYYFLMENINNNLKSDIINLIKTISFKLYTSHEYVGTTDTSTLNFSKEGFRESYDKNKYINKIYYKIESYGIDDVFTMILTDLAIANNFEIELDITEIKGKLTSDYNKNFDLLKKYAKNCVKEINKKIEILEEKMVKEKNTEHTPAYQSYKQDKKLLENNLTYNNVIINVLPALKKIYKQFEGYEEVNGFWVYDIKNNKVALEKIYKIIFEHSYLLKYFKIEFNITKFNYPWNETQFSSGETTLINMYSRIFFNLNYVNDIYNYETLILLLDEPDNSLHPEWQRKFWSFFIKDIKTFIPDKKIQIIFTTHSPILLTDIPKDCINFFNSQEEFQNDDFNTFGANIFSLFKKGFFLENTIGEFALEKLDEIVNILNKKSADISTEEMELCRKIINITGEPVLKNFLEDLYNNVNIVDYDKVITDVESMNTTQLKTLKDTIEKRILENGGA